MNKSFLSLCFGIVAFGQTAVPPYLQINGMTYLPSADMQNTTFVPAIFGTDINGGVNTTLGPAYDSRPGAANDQGLMFTVITRNSLVPNPVTGGDLFPALKNDGVQNGDAYLVNNPPFGYATGPNFYLGWYNAAPYNGRAVQATFTCTANGAVGQNGTGCGPAIWDSHNQRLYSMSYYNTLAGSQIVIQTWCFDLGGSSCPGGVHVPVWMNDNLGTFPVSSAIQNYTISYAPQCISCFDPGGVGRANNTGWIQFFVNGSQLAQIWGGNTADGGLFVNPGTTMHLYTLGGIY
jgi:hypothetical protein